MDKLKFAGFIMTYNRTDILEQTIEIVFQQSFPPEKLLIVDNSDNNLTKELITRLSSNTWPLEYIHTGYNSGPAGAANLGLKTLLEEGFDWIYWGDDDDPPQFPNVFEDLISIGNKFPKVGAVGSVGSKFNFKTGVMQRFKDEELEGVLEVNAIGGNHNLIVNGDALRHSKILPDTALFFGFEEFDFLQRLKLKGYKILVSGSSLLEHRKLKNRLGPQKIYNFLPKENKHSLNRKYYSDRNLIYILFYNLTAPLAGVMVIIRILAKSVFGFFDGFQSGLSNLKISVIAIYDGIFKRMGQRL